LDSADCLGASGEVGDERCSAAAQWRHSFICHMDTYTKEDMCDRETQPAGRQGWHDPGVLVGAAMHSLSPGTTYFYQVEDPAVAGQSEIFSFKAAPAVGSAGPVTISAFGDLGNTPWQDASWQHSWDFQNRGEIPSVNTTRRLALQNSDAVLHFGDISYAVGFLSEWDSFMKQIEPVACRVPWMASIGNHEMGYSASWEPSQDSGGECGVPFNAHFPFASQNASLPWQEREPWYAFSYGPVRVVMISTEHDYSEGSRQYTWLNKTLSSVDRATTPWVMLTGHRPMYVSSTWEGDQVVADALQKSIEPLLVLYSVNLAMWGHHHSYQRSCNLVNNTCQAAGPVHVVAGMAGYSLAPTAGMPWPPAPYWQVVDNQHWGFTQLEFHNSTSLHVSLIGDHNGTRLDSFWIHRSDGL